MTFGMLILSSAFGVLLAFIVTTILEKFEMSEMKKNLKDIKEGKVTTMDEWKKEAELWKKKHPNLYRLEQAYYSIRRFFIRIVDFFRYDIKAFIQRGKRGYANSDVWGFHRYLSEVIAGGIDKLTKEVHGYPCNLKNLKEWEVILKKISKTFKTAKEIDDDNLQYLSATLFNDKERKNCIRITKELNKKYSYYNTRTMTKKENKEYEEGWQLFQQYYFNLWD